MEQGPETWHSPFRKVGWLWRAGLGISWRVPQERPCMAAWWTQGLQLQRPILQWRRDPWKKKNIDARVLHGIHWTAGPSKEDSWLRTICPSIGYARNPQIRETRNLCCWKVVAKQRVGATCRHPIHSWTFILRWAQRPIMCQHWTGENEHQVHKRDGIQVGRWLPCDQSTECDVNCGKRYHARGGIRWARPRILWRIFMLRGTDMP